MQSMKQVTIYQKHRNIKLKKLVTLYMSPKNQANVKTCNRIVKYN